MMSHDDVISCRTLAAPRTGVSVAGVYSKSEPSPADGGDGGGDGDGGEGGGDGEGGDGGGDGSSESRRPRLGLTVPGEGCPDDLFFTVGESYD